MTNVFVISSCLLNDLISDTPKDITECTRELFCRNICSIGMRQLLNVGIDRIFFVAMKINLQRISDILKL